MKNLIIAFSLLLKIIEGSAQNAIECEMAYKECTKQFYRNLFSKDKVTISSFSKIYARSGGSYDAGVLMLSDYFKKNYITTDALIRFLNLHSDTISSPVLHDLRKRLPELTLGMDYETMSKIIDKSVLCNEGSLFTDLLEMVFPNKKSIFVELNTNIPNQIEYIWLSSGNEISSKQKFFRPGMLKEPNGYTYLKERPLASSKITRKLTAGQVFYYIPDQDFEWWAIYKTDGHGFLGYIHKSKILVYSEFPVIFKNKVKKARGGC